MYRRHLASAALAAAVAAAGCGAQSTAGHAVPRTARPATPPPTGLISYDRTEPAVYGNTTWFVDASTGATRRVPGLRVGHPSWSPDGRRIVVAVQRPAAAQGPDCSACSDLVVMNADGSHRRRITYGTGTSDAPVWSPDGTRIAYAFRSNDARYSRHSTFSIVVTDPAGTHRQVVLAHGQPRYGEPVAWSPDSQQLLLESDGPWVLDIASKRANRLTPKPTVSRREMVDDEDSVWSPTGNTIAFSRYSEGDSGPFTSTVFAVSSNGTGMTRLSDPDVHAYYPSWSPDGTRVAFVGDPVNGEGHGLCDNWGLYVADAVSGQARRIATAPHWISNPVWSPDGRYIAYEGTPAGERCSKDSAADVYVIAAGGGTPRALTGSTPGDPEGLLLTWQPTTH